jgi:large subunit ribosomal protein L24e
MPKCSFCGNTYENPRGLTLVMTDGRINYLCSSKCRKNMLMKRRNVIWANKSNEGAKLKIKEEKSEKQK